MLPSHDIQHTVDRQLFPDTHFFHGLSRPVIRQIDGHYNLAMFVTPFSVLGFSDGLFDRPYFWVAADIETGDLVRVFQCNSEPDEEFCDSVYERRYDLRLVSDKSFSDDYYESAFSILDNVRLKLIETNDFDTRLYKLYIKRILKACPLPYRKFFRDLSIPLK